MKDVCRGCESTVRLRPVDVDRLVAEYLRRKPREERADEALVRERLAICRTCVDLQYSTTCRHCGCLVEVRARIAAARCPKTDGARW